MQIQLPKSKECYTIISKQLDALGMIDITPTFANNKTVEVYTGNTHKVFVDWNQYKLIVTNK